jgi:hypothetical protein
MTEKHVRNMSPEESAAWLREHARKVREAAPVGLKPEPPPTDRHATMTPAEIAAFKRKFGL